MKAYSEMTKNEKDNLLGNIVAWTLLGFTFAAIFLVVFGNHL